MSENQDYGGYGKRTRAVCTTCKCVIHYSMAPVDALCH